MATRAELTGVRELAFSSWIRKELPDSASGFCVTNQDWVFWNWKTRQLLLAEEKTRNGKVAKWFYRLIADIIHPALCSYARAHDDIDYRGYHLIQFENTGPDDGKIYFDEIERTKTVLRDFL